MSATQTQTQAPSTYMHAQFRYGDREHEQYQRDGYVKFDRFLSEQGLRHASRETDRMIGECHPSISPEDIMSPHVTDRWAFELACEPKLLEMVARQIGPDIILWASGLLCKPPRTGQLVPWHQDVPYWNLYYKLGVKPEKFAGGVWIPFDDIDRENGAMAVLPGWHRKGVLPRCPSNVPTGFHEAIDPASLPADIDESKVEYIMRAGGAATHDALMPHNSPPNVSNRWRRVLILRYIAADAALESKTYKDFRTGQPVDRRFFLVHGRDPHNRDLPRSPFE